MPGDTPVNIVIISTGEQLHLGSVRRFVADMDAAGADDTAPVWSSAAPRNPSGRGDDFPGGLTELTALGGYPRLMHTGPLPPRPEPGD